MERKTWYFYSLWLPFIVPGFLCLVGPYFKEAATHRLIPALFEVLAGICAMQLFMGSIPYGIFVIGVLWWGRDRSAEDLRKASWWLPVYFLPLAFAEAIFIGESDLKLRSLSEWGLGFALTGGVVLIFGYFYVLLAHVLIRLAQKAGWVRD